MATKLTHHSCGDDSFQFPINTINIIVFVLLFSDYSRLGSATHSNHADNIAVQPKIYHLDCPDADFNDSQMVNTSK